MHIISIYYLHVHNKILHLFCYLLYIYYIENIYRNKLLKHYVNKHRGSAL